MMKTTVEKKESGYLTAIRQFAKTAYEQGKYKKGAYFSFLGKIIENAEDETNDKVYWVYGGPWDIKQGIIICDNRAIKGLYELQRFDKRQAVSRIACMGKPAGTIVSRNG